MHFEVPIEKSPGGVTEVKRLGFEKTSIRVAYLQDVLMRVDTHPASRINELLPQHWTPPLRWTETP